VTALNGGAAGVGGDLVTVAGVLSLAVVAGALFVVWKAWRAHRQHASRAMLLLAVGLFLLVPTATVIDIAGSVLTRGVPDDSGRVVLTYGAVSILEQVCRLAGVGCLVASLYVRE
jgi:hypothetical protein